jgi:hypothetical protein
MRGCAPILPGAAEGWALTELSLARDGRVLVGGARAVPSPGGGFRTNPLFAELTPEGRYGSRYTEAGVFAFDVEGAWVTGLESDADDRLLAVARNVALRIVPDERGSVTTTRIPLEDDAALPSIVDAAIAPGGGVLGLTSGALTRARGMNAATLQRDDTFGQAGTARLVPPPRFIGVDVRIFARRVFVDGRSRSYVVSYARVASEDRVLVQRYLANGQLDMSFANGAALVPLITAPDRILAAMDDARRTLVLALEEENGSRIVRFDESGIDTSFGAGGEVLVPRGRRSLTRIALMQDGRMVVSLYDPDGVSIRRLGRDGRFDATYGSSGEARFTPGMWPERAADTMLASAIRIGQDGSAFVLLTGDVAQPTEARSLVCKLSP